MTEQLQDRAGQATSLMGIGLAYYAQGNYPLALEYLQKNLALSQSLNDQNRLAETLHALGLAHARQQNYDLALGSYERSLKLYEEMSNRPGAAVMLNLIGGIYYVQGKYDRALDSYQQALAQLYGAARSRVYVGAQAREQSAKEDAARFRVLHLAAPGVVGDVSPMYSHVALAQTVGKDDGLLEVWEMMQMNWHADLAVWSASETARAATGSGEGITGLGWSLFAAGCPTLVTSQWRTQSPGTTELMLAFHGELQAASNRRERLTKAQALQQAILKMLKGESYKQPFYWAGFAMVGDGR